MFYLQLTTFLLRILLTRGELIDDPTLKPTPNFSASGDADALIKAENDHIKGHVASIIFHKTYDERKKIEECYNQKYSSETVLTLLGQLQLISGYGLNSLYTQSLQPPERILADMIHQTITTKESEMGGIEEVVCANDTQMKCLIDKYYQENYQQNVESHLATFRAEDEVYQDVMKKYCWNGLCQDKNLTEDDADKEAQALRGIRAKKHETDFKNKLIELLDKYCEPDLKLIFQKYRQNDYGIEDAISDAFKCKRQRRAYDVLVRYIEDTCKFYAYELRHAADDSGNIHIDKINRIILTRSERDLFCIAKAYPSQDKGYETFTSRLSDKVGWYTFNNMAGPDMDTLYVESIRYLLGKP